MKQCFPQVGLLDREILFHLKVARECTEVSEVGCSYVINYEYILCTFRLGENTATNKHEIYATLRSLMDSCWVLVNYCWVLVDSYWVLVDTTVEQIVCISIQNTDIIVYKFKFTFSFAFHTVCGRSVIREV